MNHLLLLSLLAVVAVQTQARLGTRCTDQSMCVADAECCVVSSYLIKRGKCAARKNEGDRCKVGATYMSKFWNLPYACGCGDGTTCVEENWQDPAFPGVNLKRDRCRKTAARKNTTPEMVTSGTRTRPNMPATTTMPMMTTM